MSAMEAVRPSLTKDVDPADFQHRTYQESLETIASQRAAATTDFGPNGTSTSLPSAPRITAALSGWPNARPGPTALTTSRSQPLRASLDRPCSRTPAVSSPVSAAKPAMI